MVDKQRYTPWCLTVTAMPCYWCHPTSSKQHSVCVCMCMNVCVCMYVCVCVCVLTCCRAIDLETKYLRRGTQQATNMPIPCNLQPTHKHTHTAIRQSYQMLLSSMSLMQSYTCDMLNSLPCHVTCRQLYR